MSHPRFILLFLSLLTTALAWQPVPGQMLTPWGEKVTPDNAWQEYPRPAYVRDGWQNLNGLWSYAITPAAESDAPATWAGEILVPFALESALSGVGKKLTPNDALWYRREFTVEPTRGKRTLLHFEAVDYQTTVWVNGKQVGTHTGSSLPFSFDITSVLQAGKNHVTVRVLDATDTPGTFQTHGKQVAEPGGIWYTPVSGIWQTVWLEQVPDAYLADIKLMPKLNGEVTIELIPGGSAKDRTSVEVVASLGGKQVASASGKGRSLTLTIQNPQLWSPASPTLYDLDITYGSDKVRSYVGLRETSVVKDANGHLRFALNGKEVFHFGPLDQGWWPDGLLTPPSEAAMRSDLEFLKAAGFNTVRKHIKVEPRRYYTDCDRLGFLVWQDQVSSGTGQKRGTGGASPKWTRLEPTPTDADWPDEAHRQFMAELKGMIDALHDHPSIVQWVPFNEAWGQHRTMEVGKWVLDYDSTRQVNAATGGNFFPVGHIVDEHRYPHPGFPFELGEGGRFDGFVKVVGEFGGHGFPVEDHLWSTTARNWGYGGLPKDKNEWLERYKTSMAMLAELRKQGIAAGIYTQTTDVEGEINGLITYDRKVQKLTPAQLAAIHREAGFTR